MRVILQVVKQASVKVDGKLVSQIDKGYLLLVGLTPGDDEAICNKMAAKIAKLRVFEDTNGKINLSLKDVGGEILSVSQFTLYAGLKDGNRPSFVSAMRPEQAKPLWEYFNKALEKEIGSGIQTGIFQAMMDVSLINDGPTTIILDSKELWG
ncbi:MAG: D-aminoacyl-tRNA deacylase [Bacillota bacterium]|nr:D-aminoacyl-tRNA deacylase [Bacillota bacterium]